MLRAIDFDYQPFSPADKVDYIGAKWDLPDKFMTIQVAAPQFAPKAVLRFGLATPQLPGT
jgi:hypothetical protein